jgi:hypothetical protein
VWGREYIGQAVTDDLGDRSPDIGGVRPDEALDKFRVDELARQTCYCVGAATGIYNDKLDADASSLSDMLGREQCAVQDRGTRYPHDTRQRCE